MEKIYLVKCTSHEMWYEVQKLLLKQGFTWITRTISVSYPNRGYVPCIRLNQPRYLSYSSEEFYSKLGKVTWFSFSDIEEVNWIDNVIIPQPFLSITNT